MADVVPAEAFPPGEYLRDELEERGWTQEEFARVIRRPPRLVSEVISGKRGITPETAIRFSAALGTSAQFWMNLETAYRLYEIGQEDATPERITREANLRENFPVRELTKRGWVEDSEDVEVLEARVLRFYGVRSVDEDRVFAHAARRTSEVPALQEAWLHRVKQVAECAVVPAYSPSKLAAALPTLHTLMSAPEEARQVAKVLQECGVRFVVVEPMTGSRIDGVCFWLGESPVVGLSLRIDRIDNFWFVLRHELEHVLRGDGRNVPVVDTDLCGGNGESDEDGAEAAANAAATEFCVPVREREDFLARVGVSVPDDRVVLFARRLGVHPGIVVGQLQWRLQRFNFLRKYLVKVRHLVTPSVLTDGYGRQVLTTA